MTTVIDVRRARRQDPVVAVVPATEPVVRRLVLACSPEALRRRFHTSCLAPEVVWDMRREYLLAGPPEGAAVVAMSGDVPVGLLNLVVVETAVVDVGLLVVDAWQRRGVASRLLAEELGRPRWAGWTVQGTVQPDNHPARALLAGVGWGEWRVVARDPSAWDYATTLLG